MMWLIDLAIEVARRERAYAWHSDLCALALWIDGVESGHVNRYGAPDDPDWRVRYWEAIATDGFADDVGEAILRHRLCGS